MNVILIQIPLIKKINDKLTFTDHVLIKKLFDRPFYLVTIYNYYDYFPKDVIKRKDQMMSILNTYQKTLITIIRSNCDSNDIDIQQLVTYAYIKEIDNDINSRVKFIQNNRKYFSKLSNVNFVKLEKHLSVTNRRQRNLKEIAKKMKMKYHIIYKAARHILNFTYVKFNRINKKMSSDQVNYQMFYFSYQLNRCLESNMIIIYFDESKFNTHKITPKLWISKKTKKVFKDEGRLSNVNLILACTKDQIIHYEISLDSFNTKIYIDFIETLIEKIVSKEDLKEYYYNKRIVLIVDNCSVHRSKELKTFMFKTLLNYLTLPAYTPTINLAEYVFKILKSRFYNSIFKNV